MATRNPPTRFEQAVAIVLLHEGGFVQHPRDPGGATKFGITRETLSRARGRPVSSEDVRDLTRVEAADIYRRLYWEAVRADELPPGLDLAVFDLAVHSGASRAASMLQAQLAVETDGIIGPVTLAAASAADAPAAIRALTRSRLDFLARLPTSPIFGRGWRRRVLSIERDALRLASLPPLHQG
ncbi:lysozyme family protein [Microvirga flocculans]|uniref:Lysozyme family protein n=1 Tax=Microvirga flocculans TaxID=217168 RepID=A0A7W6IH54_9HYPH|nr:glycosyl hydrolase 108 family protein [Microvirga flocculans]MBB4041397.1 lysozyme family protein [Microvirga flocculans]